MNRNKQKRRGLALAATCLALAAIGGPASPAGAAEPCPNEAIREEQGSTMLDECRAWEMVSARDKNQYHVLPFGLRSSDGDRLLYETFAGYPGGPTGVGSKLLAVRTTTGWETTVALPPRPEMVGPNYAFFAATPDLSSWIASAFEGMGGPALAADESLVRINTGASQDLLYTFSRLFGSNGIDGVASEDLSRVYAAADESIDPSHQPDTKNIYDFGSGTPQLISRMPGTGMAPTCGIREPQVAFASRNTSSSLNWISKDGSHAFFLSPGDDAPACTAPYQLYLRNRGTETTTRLSSPPTGAGPDRGVEFFVQAAPDGSWAFFQTATSYVAADDGDGDSADGDIYKWSQAAGLACATCIVPSADVLSRRAESPRPDAAVSDDGSFVYFTSAAQLADAPGAGSESKPNLYVLHADSIHFITELGTERNITSNPFHGGDLTPDGEVFVFWANGAGLNMASGSDNGGLGQYYRYDDRDKSFTCLSCPPGAVPATTAVDVPLAVTAAAVPPDLHVVTDDGEKVFFASANALVPSDENGAADIYEWDAGVRHLVTNAVSDPYGITRPELLDVSPDGRDVLFLDSAHLTFEAVDAAVKLYDARIGGGFAAPPAPPAPCLGEDCLPSSAPQPVPLASGSDAIAGEANVRPRHRKRKPSKRHRNHHRHAAKHNRGGAR